MTKVSPIAEYLIKNNAIAKRDKFGCHFYSPQGLYLGLLRKSVVNNYTLFQLSVVGDSFKRMYTKSTAIGQQFAYVVNEGKPQGVCITPIKTFMRQISVDFINKTSHLVDSETSLTNNLNLLSVDEQTGVGLYDKDGPFKYETKITHEENNKLKFTKFNFFKH